MFQKKLQEIVNTISEQNQLFEGKGFVRNTRVMGGFDGITSEYNNYFYAYVKSEEDEDKYKFEKVEGGCDVVNLEFSFKLIFDLSVCCEDFLQIIIVQLNQINNVFVEGASDESEIIYKLETGDDLKTDDCDFYSFSCKYKGIEYLDFSCLENKTITKEICKPII